jgi:PAS domain S-box-containing protein
LSGEGFELKNNNIDKNNEKRPISSDNKNIALNRALDVEKSTLFDLELKNSLLDFASDSIWVIDFKGNFLYVNKSAYKTLGFTKKELMNMNIHELDAPEYSESIDQYLKELMETGEAKYETCHYHKDGSQIPVEIQSKIIELNGQKLVLSIIRDINIYKNFQNNSEKAIKNQTEEFRKLNNKLRKKEKMALNLNNLKEKLLKSMFLEEKLKLITDNVVEMFDADIARIWLLKNADLCDEGCIYAKITKEPHKCKNRSSCFHLVASSGRYADLNGYHRRIPMGSYKIGRIAASDDFNFVINRAVHDPRINYDEWVRNLGLDYFYGFVLGSEDGKPIGVLGLFRKEVLDSDSEFLLEDLANTTSQVIINWNIGQTLLTSENKYRTLTEASTDSIFLFDKNLHYVYLNSQALKMVGLKPDEIIGKGLEVAFPSELVKYMKTNVKNVFKSGEPFSEEHKYVLSSGERWLNTSLIPIKEDDITNFVLGISRDITEYKLFQVESKEREEELRLLTEKMTDVIFQIDSDCIITYVSPSLKQLSGYNPREIIKKRIENFIHPEDVDQVLDILRKLPDNKKSVNIEYRIKRSDGINLWVESSCNAIYDVDGTFKSIVLVTRNINKRKNTEEQIKIKNQTLQGINKIFEESLISEDEHEVSKSSLNVCKEITNSKFGWILELNSKGGLNTLSGSDHGWGEYFITEKKNGVLPNGTKEHGLFGKVIRDGRSFFTNDPHHHESSVRTSPSHPRITSFLGVPLEQGGKVIGAICLANKEDGYNLKDQEIMEKLSVAISESLMRKRAESSLITALKDKDLLIKEIHHRVKNNLMVISSLLNLQSRYIKDKEALGLFRESQSRAKSMALIHERLYKSEDFKTINFGDYITNLADILYNTYMTDKNRVKLDLQMENMDDLKVDINNAIPLGLIVNELLSNAMKHAFPKDMSGMIIVDFSKEDDQFELVVSDNGIGFPQELDYKNTESLGLQVVNTLTNQIGGKITMEVDNGTTFTIKFKEDFD